jgi:hypothetical protein
MTNVNPREFAPPGTMEQVRDYWSHRQTAYADHETAVREIRAAMDNLNCAVEDAYGPSSRSHLNGSCVSSEQLRKLHAWMELQTDWLNDWTRRVLAANYTHLGDAEAKREAAEEELARG